jgi:RNA polymerase primary sigma factor
MSSIRSKNHGVATGPQLYLKDIKDDSLLTAAEERELADAIARGDKEARQRMIEANLRLVVRIARDYVGHGISLDDLIGEGNLGLIRATQAFDPRFGTRFSTYASHWIKQAIRLAMISSTATIRLPAYMATLLTSWRRAERALHRDLGRMPGLDEVALSLGLTEAQKAMVSHAHQAARLGLESTYGWGAGAGILAGVADRHSAEEPVEAEDEWAVAQRRLERLEGSEFTVVALRFGLEGEALSIEEISRRLGMTRRRVRQVVRRALDKLRYV